MDACSLDAGEAWKEAQGGRDEPSIDGAGLVRRDFSLRGSLVRCGVVRSFVGWSMFRLDLLCLVVPDSSSSAFLLSAGHALIRRRKQVWRTVTSSAALDDEVVALVVFKSLVGSLVPMMTAAATSQERE